MARAQRALAADSRGLDRIYGFVVRANRIKGLDRAGWVMSGIAHPEHVGDHSFSTALLSFIMARRLGLDAHKCMLMALVHDVHEAITGDIPSRLHEKDQEYTNARKKALERRDTMSMLSMLPVADRASLAKIWKELDAGKTRESALVREVDRLDIALQLLVYHKRMKKYRRDEFLDYADGRITVPELRYMLSRTRKEILGRRA